MSDFDGCWPTWNDIWNGAKQTVKAVGGCVLGAVGYVSDTASEISNGIKSLITNPVTTIKNIGTNIVLSIATQSYSPVNIIKDKAKTIVNVSKSKDALITGYAVGHEIAGPAAVTVLTYGLSKGIDPMDIFSANNGWGFNRYGRINLLYENPRVNGGTFINIRNSAGEKIFRIDWDPINGLHSHPPGHK